MRSIILAQLLLVGLLCGCTNESEQQITPLSAAAKRVAIESAMLQLDAGRTVEALAITSKLILRDPNSLEILENHAIVLLAEAARVENDGQFEQALARREEALDVYLRACTFEGVSGGTQLSAGQLAHMLGEISLAQSFYAKSHVALPSDGRSAFYLAQIEMLEENWIPASQWIAQCLERQPHESFTLISAGLIEANLEHCHQADLYTTKAIKLKPNDANLRIMQSRILRICNQPKRALEILSTLQRPLFSSQIVQQEIALCQALIGAATSE